MSCKQAWNDRFIISQTNKTFFDNSFMKSRKQFLLDAEISKIPQSMEAAENYKLVKDEEKIVVELGEKIKEINKELTKLKMTRQEHYQNIYNLKNGKGKTERKKFIMPCPHNGCKGFLSQQYKCEICKLYTCPNCYEVIGYNKTDEHECKKESVESAELIRKDTKPCPNCGVRIFKISGCFHPDTEILMFNGTIKLAKDINLNDKLIGDDGNERTVIDLIDGFDKMFLIKQNKGRDYIVNSQHTLVLYYCRQGHISYIKKLNLFKLYWFDIINLTFKTKHFDNHNNALLFLNNLKKENKISLDKLINIKLKDYLNLTKSYQSILKGIKLEKSINWPEKFLELDPYILGLWIGDGYSNGKEFCTDDKEILEYWQFWALTNNAIISETTTKYRYYIKNADNINKNSYKNPLKAKLNYYNLVNNKDIPNDYLINSKDNRLKLLAGIIDTDGCVQNDGRRIIIVTTIKNISDKILFLAKSLGFNVNIRINKREQEKLFNEIKVKDYKDQYIINISGKNIHEIPTILERKKCKEQIGGVNLLTTNIEIIPLQTNKFYGWTVTHNHRFILPDFTIVKNCDQMWCTECETTFSWNTGRVLVNVQVHNPHFYARQREIQNGNMNRDPRDVLCGGLCTFQQLRTFIVLYINSNEPLFNEITNLTAVDINEWHRFVAHITHVELYGTRQRLQHLRNNQGILIEYIVNERTKESLATQILRNDKNSKKLVELVNIYELLSVYGIESFGYLTNGDFKRKKIKDIFEIVIKQYNEYQKLITYCNEQLKIISLTYNCQVLQVANNVPRALVGSKQEFAKGYDFKIESKKFNLKDITDKQGKDEGSCSYH
jgi:hypothetical protein